MTVQVNLGATLAQESALLDLGELLATRLLVQGNSGSGKSHLLRRLLEESAAHVQQVVIDPEGDFVTLSDRYGHVVVDGNRSVADLECIAARLRQHRVSAVLTLDSLDAEMQMRAAAVFLNALFDADRSAWFPMLVVVDEAQLFAPAVGGDVAEDARKLSLGAMTNLMCRGRKRGLAGVIATQRLAKLAKNVAAEATNFLMGRTFLDIDMARAADLLGLERRQAEMFRDLKRGQFVALGPALARRPLTIAIGEVATQPRAPTPTLTPLPDQDDDAARAMILAPIPAAAVRRPPDRQSPPPPVATLVEAIVRERPLAPLAPAEVDPPALVAGEQAAVYGTIATEIMADAEASFRPDGVLHQDFVVRCRMRRLPGERLPLREVRLFLNVARAGMSPDDPAFATRWQGAVAIAEEVPEDLQAVFLILAAAALRGMPCPIDAVIAARCGQHATGRVRSRIGHLEKRGTLVVRTDFSGRRIVILPELGWETAPGETAKPPTSRAPRPIGVAVG